MLLLLPLAAGGTAGYTSDSAGMQREEMQAPGGGRGGSKPVQMLAAGIHYLGRGLIGESAHNLQRPWTLCTCQHAMRAVVVLPAHLFLWLTVNLGNRPACLAQ